MRLLRLAAVFASVFAFEDTSPYIFASTSQHPINQHTGSTLSSGSFRQSVLAALTCEAPTTIIAVQPSIHASDFTHDAAPLFKQTVESAGTKLVVPYGHGEVDVEELVLHIAGQCNALIERITAGHGSHPMYTDDGIPRVLVVTFPTVPEKQGRLEALNEHDAFLHSLIASVPRQQYNLIYVSTPAAPSKATYRRAVPDLSAYKSHSNSTGGLFSHYQFFTPGIFMGYMALLLLVPILIVGIKAISSLQISYGAFAPPMKVGNKQQ
ncbi:vacuolar ATP synthase subunit S1-domain-containing protein [Protomyces lactucae-debilis]|uniref:Protein BIG1 n=1 Tax=Protomyces lactucae-debilis TaxID=2754530 RepID=A0A1Y2FGG1_PROLT|nr:vacuolar ATP synthase subunit S1-domain-containing protein [Protomyces lactucae-debilis]ORY82504.1 vacuolar ATP synthase subunit S1-domain-containing protein [Protomyces lactucae-debilis]